MPSWKSLVTTFVIVIVALFVIQRVDFLKKMIG